MPIHDAPTARYPGHHAVGPAELASLLRDQHEELRLALVRLRDLTGAARDDEFLQVRRRLAVHEALEERLTPACAATDAHRARAGGYHAEVLALEQAGTGAASFVRGVDALLDGRLPGDVELQPDALTPAQQAVAATAVDLWLGEGEVYLGHRYDDMVRTAREQLAAAPEQEPLPPR